MDRDEEFNDLLVFIDEDGVKKSLAVKILGVDSFVTYKTKGGNTISIPARDVIKVKRAST